jgi:hypothetical protein
MSMLLSHSGDGALHGSYNNAVLDCEGASPWDGLTIPASGAVTKVLLGESWKLGPGFPTYYHFSLQLVSPDETEPYPIVILLHGSLAPPDTIYGGASWAGAEHAECSDGSCSLGGFGGVRERL